MSFTLLSCNTFTYKTYDPALEEKNEDPDPDYQLTLNEKYQDYTNYLFPGNRVENFVTYFNTYYNALEEFEFAYEEYTKRNLENYSERIDSAYAKVPLSQEVIDKFNKSISKNSKVIQYHKSSDFMDDAVLMIGKSYYYLGDYLKAERKFAEFISRLSASPKYDEAILFLSKTQLRSGITTQPLNRLNNLAKTSPDSYIRSEAHKTLAEYYLSIKDYDRSIASYKNAINISPDNKIRAQMQYLVASVIAKNEPLKASSEFERVKNYDADYTLEYFANYNNVKNLILGNSFGSVAGRINDLKIKYKDEPVYLADIELLEARYEYQKGNHVQALNKFKALIKKYPSSVTSSDAAFFIGDYYENHKNDYLNAYRYYRLALEQNLTGRNFHTASNKSNVFKRYFELRSVIEGQSINTEYNDEIINILRGDEKGRFEKNMEGIEGERKGRGSGLSSEPDTLEQKQLEKANAMFELSELFLYDIKNTDSAEYYLKNAYEQTSDADFRSKVLFAIASLYSSQGLNEKYSSVLSDIIQKYPATIAANESRKLLNMPVVEISESLGTADSIFRASQEMLLREDYANALAGFKVIIDNYPDWKNIEKVIYSAGWIYENALPNADSAYKYYDRLIVMNPMSEYTKMVGEKVVEYRNSKEVNNNNITGQENIKENNITPEPEQEKIQENPDVNGEIPLEEPVKIQVPTDEGIRQQEDQTSEDGEPKK